MSFALFLVVRSSGHLVGKVALLVEQQTHCMGAFTKHTKDSGEVLEKANDQTIGAIWKFHERAWNMTSDKDLQAFVRARGLQPFLQDARGMVNLEIQAIAEQLGISREQAIQYMRSRIETGPVTNGNEDR